MSRLFWQLWADFCQKRTIELSRHNARNLPDPNQCYHCLWQLHFEVTTVCGNLGLESFLNQIEVTTIGGNFGLKAGLRGWVVERPTLYMGQMIMFGLLWLRAAPRAGFVGLRGWVVERPTPYMGQMIMFGVL